MNRKTEQKIFLFFSHPKPLKFKAGEVFLRPDDVPSGVFFLKRGYVRDYTISENGEELTLTIFKPGDIFPLPWAINNDPIVRYFEAFTPVEVFRKPRELFLDFLVKEPVVLYWLTRNILTRLSGLMKRIESLEFGSAYTKVISNLLDCASGFGKAENGSVEILLPLTHRHIGLLIGINRETASRQLEILMKKGLVSHNKRLLKINDIKKLKAEMITHSFKRQVKDCD